MQIGCQYHSIIEWGEFDDSKINGMDSQAVDFWDKHKALVMAVAEAKAMK